MVAFSYCTRSIFSWPRSTCAVPLETTTSLSFFSGSNFTAARLFECNCVVASSDLTAALESGDRKYGVAKSTARLNAHGYARGPVAFGGVFFHGNQRVRLDGIRRAVCKADARVAVGASLHEVAFVE